MMNYHLITSHNDISILTVRDGANLIHKTNTIFHFTAKKVNILFFIKLSHLSWVELRQRTRLQKKKKKKKLSCLCRAK